MAAGAQIASGISEQLVHDIDCAWPDDRHEMEFGTITLTKHVNEEDREIKKIIFDPVPRVDGIDPSDDPLIPTRSDIYLLSGRTRRGK